MSVRQIAAALSLSPSAVSLALRNSAKIPNATRQRVMTEAKRIGYRPSAKLKEVMAQLRFATTRPVEASFGVMSFYDTQRPWEHSTHLKRIYESMERRATQLGYRLDPLRLRAPGMTHARFRSILEARGIRGLLCFGSPRLDEVFPKDFDSCAVVTVGLSIETPLHRVTSHHYNDLTHVLQKVYARGYRRPGLVIGRYEDRRSGHSYAGAYLAWCDHLYGQPVAPIMRLDRVEETPLLDWLHTHSLDVIVFVHLYDVVADFQRVLKKNSIRVPDDIGVVAVSQILDGTGFAGIQQDQELMGSWAVELLTARIANGDFGIPENPRIEMVEGHWIDGPSLAQRVNEDSLPVRTGRLVSG